MEEEKGEERRDVELVVSKESEIMLRMRSSRLVREYFEGFV